MATSKINQAGQFVHSHFQNHGFQVNGSTINIGGSLHVANPISEKDVEKQCRRALRNNLDDPIEDREKILALLTTPLITAAYDWVKDNELYKSWRNIRTRSRLLWISGGQARGKTMLAIFLTQEFDKRAYAARELTVLYYFIDRQENKDTAVHVLRGLICRLLEVRKDLIQHLLEHYEICPDTLFGPNQLPLLWRVFINMVRDPRAGQVYCIIDGLDRCKEDSLRLLVGLIRNYFLKEAAEQDRYDNGYAQHGYGQPGSAGSTAKERGPGLKMMLISREEPEWLKAYLQPFPRMPMGGGGSSKKTGTGKAKKPRNIRDVAKTIIRQQTLQKEGGQQSPMGQSSSSAPENSIPTNAFVKPASAPAYIHYNATSPASGTIMQPSDNQPAASSTSGALTTSPAHGSVPPSAQQSQASTTSGAVAVTSLPSSSTSQTPIVSAAPTASGVAVSLSSAYQVTPQPSYTPQSSDANHTALALAHGHQTQVAQSSGAQQPDITSQGTLALTNNPQSTPSSSSVPSNLDQGAPTLSNPYQYSSQSLTDARLEVGGNGLSHSTVWSSQGQQPASISAQLAIPAFARSSSQAGTPVPQISAQDHADANQNVVATVEPQSAGVQGRPENTPSTQSFNLMSIVQSHTDTPPMQHQLQVIDPAASKNITPSTQGSPVPVNTISPVSAQPQPTPQPASHTSASAPATVVPNASSVPILSGASPSEAAPPEYTASPSGFSGSSTQPFFQDVKYSQEPDDYAGGESAATAGVQESKKNFEETGAYTEEPEATAYPQEREDVEGFDEEDEEDFNPSLKLYIEAKIKELPPNAPESLLTVALEHRGDGTFLWIDFAVEELKKVPVEMMEDTVNSLPPELDQMYTRILLNIPPELVEFVVGLLRWIVCARRPMDLLELAVALNLSHHSPEQASATIVNAVGACGHMIKIREKDWTVNLVHQSLIDFLTGESSQLLSDPRLSRFHINPGIIHGDITTFCISYLECGPFNQHVLSYTQNQEQYNQHIMQWPLVPYAASFWPDHLKEATNPFINLSSPFFLPKSVTRKNWWKTYWGFTTGKHTFMSPVNFNVLHLAAYLNLVPVAQQVLQRGELLSRINARDSHSMTPLEYTVALGNIEMFHFLLSQNAKQDTLGESLLELACRKGQRDMASLLLDMGWDVNQRAQPINALGNLYTMTRWLPGAFSEGVDMNRDQWHMLFRDVGVQETPLHQAVTYGHIQVAEMLLSRGAKVDNATTKGFTPLHAAAYTGQLECIQLLVDYHSNPNWVTTDNWLPLHYAAMRGKLSVVEFFLDRGVPVDAMTIKSKTALHLAAYAGHAELVEFLVERGANRDLQSYKGETPLHLATRHTKPQVVELLLALGANQLIMNNDGFTPLQVAQASKMTTAVECARILSTFGTEGYVPWQPPQQLAPAPTVATSVENLAETDAQYDAQADGRRASVAQETPNTKTFGHAAVPRSNTFQGFSASVSVEVQPADAPNQGQSAQTVQGNINVSGLFSASAAAFGHAQQSQGTPSKFSYDPNANMQTYADGDSATAFASMTPPSVPPPPYSAAVGSSPPPAFPEKSAAWTSQFQQPATQTGQQVGMAAGPSSPPVQSVPPVQISPPVHPMAPSSTLPQHTASAPITPAATSPPIAPPSTVPRSMSTQSGMVQMLSSLSISSISRAPTPAVPELPATTPTIQTSPPPTSPPQQHPQKQYQQQQQQQPYYPPTTPNPQFQTPSTSSVQTVQPTPLMSPFQAHATPVSPNPNLVTPMQPFPGSPSPIPQQQPIPYQLPGQTGYIDMVPPQPVTPIQPQPTYPIPMQPQPTTPQFQNPYPQQPLQPPPQPVQSPFFSGNSTASTYNSNYTYSAPPPTPYNPQLGNMQQQSPMQGQYNPQFGNMNMMQQQQPPQGQWPMQPMFSGPPQPVPKKKGFLGGLLK